MTTPRRSRFPELTRFSTALLVLALGACDHVTVQAPRVVQLKIQSGDQQVAEVGTTLAQPLVVEVDDQSGVPVEGVTVTFQGNARGSSAIVARSDASGIASARWQLGGVPGSQSLRASVDQPNVPGHVSFIATALTGPPANIVLLSDQEFLGVPGTELDTITVLVSDRFGNPSRNTALSWAVQTGKGSVRALSEQTDLSARARAVWTLGPALGVHTVAVSAGPKSLTLNGTAVPPFVARQVVAGSDHSCALTEDGTAYCWGSNVFGQLGIGSSDRGIHRLPAVVMGGLRFQSIVAGTFHSCGLAMDGTTWCWGSNIAGQLGGVSMDEVDRPTRTPATPLFSSLTAGSFHTCGLTVDGEAHCWGDNSVGQLGRGTDRSTVSPYFGLASTSAKVAGSLAFSSLTASEGVTCGVTKNGESHCWGANGERVLGETSQTCRISSFIDDPDDLLVYDVPCATSPIRIFNRAPVTSIALERYGACAVLATTELECWGYSAPPTIVAGARVTKAWALPAEVCGLETTGSVACWHQLTRFAIGFATVKPLGQQENLVDIHSSGRHHCGIARDAGSTVYCWGTNYDGALGDGTTIHRDFPVAVVGPPKASSARQP